MKLGIDLDGTSCDYDGGMRAFHGTRLGIHPELWDTHMPEPPLYKFWMNQWPSMSTFDEYWAVHLNAVRDGLFARLEAYPHLAEGTRRLADAGHELTIITARDLGPELEQIVLETTNDFLDRNKVVHHDLIITNDKRGLGMDVYFDDAAHNVELLRAEGSSVVIADQLHNRDLPGLRAHNWQQFVDIVNDLSTQERGVSALTYQN